MIPALILAGGLGTRLRSVVGDVPKPMAEVAGKPFLWWLLTCLEREGVRDAYLSVGYRHEQVSAGFGDAFGQMRLQYIVETEPLGTGGALLRAAAEIDADAFLVFNGDTLAMTDLSVLVERAQADRADVAIALARVDEAQRYGTVDIDGQGRVLGFAEKGRTGPGAINAGIYVLRKAALTSGEPMPEKFSFEQDFLARRFATLRVCAYPQVSDFIDIGVPDDYQAAQTKIPRLVLGR